MQLEIRKYLFDIQTAISSIDEYLGGVRNFYVYMENKLLRRAVERELEIIGEAAKRVLQLDPNINIEHVRKIIDLRNWVIHSYDKVDDVIIWGILSKHLPKLKEDINKLFDKYQDQTDSR